MAKTTGATVLVRDPSGVVWMATPADIIETRPDGEVVVLTRTGVRLTIPGLDAWVHNRVYDGRKEVA